MSLFPWQADDWRRFQKQQDRLPHAILFVGPSGIGQTQFIRACAERLLCESPAETGFACGRCTACVWIAADTHPDWHELHPESDSQVIKMDAVRECQAKLQQSIHHGAHRIVIVEPAESLSAATANALLKVLEEPTPGTQFFLLCTEPSRMLPTLKSRCQTFSLHIPTAAESMQYWQTRGYATSLIDILMQWFPHAPLTAEQYANQEEFQRLPDCQAEWEAFSRGEQSPIEMAKTLVALPEELAFLALTHWVETELQTLLDSHRERAQQLFFYRDACYEWRRQILLHNPNKQLLLERLCCRWYELRGGWLNG